MADRISAPRSEGIGLTLPERKLSHADPEWYQRDLDEPIEDPDAEPIDPLPTQRHRQIPD
jgi:hypothetical protein